MKTLYNTLKVQDYFYIIFLHEFKGETKQHSYISVFLSLIVNVVTITIFFINFSHLLKRNEPSISYSKIDLLKGINITMNTPELLFSIFLRDKNHSPLNNPSLITINATYEILFRNRDGNINNQVYQLDIINCSNFYNDYINNNIQSQYNENDIKLHYCFNYSKSNIIIGGRYSDIFYGSLSIYISKCQNKSNSDIICESEEIIKEKIKDSWLQIYYSTNSINSENFSDPIRTDLSSFYIRLHTDLNKQIYTYFGSLDFLSYENFLFDNYKKKSVIKMDHSINDILLNSENDNNILATIYVCSSMTKEKIERRYIKIQEVGSRVYGIFYVQNIIVSIILYFPQLRLMDIEIINALFDYKPKYFSYKKKKVDEIFYRRYSNFKQAKFNPIPFKKRNNIKTKNGSEIDLQNQKKKLNIKRINTCDLIKISLCYCNSKYKKSRDEMNFLMKEKRKYTDLAESLKIYLDMEKIKELIIEKGICDSDLFIFQKKLLRYDTKKGLRAYKGKMTTNIFKPTNSFKENCGLAETINFYPNNNNCKIINNLSINLEEGNESSKQEMINLN